MPIKLIDRNITFLSSKAYDFNGLYLGINILLHKELLNSHLDGERISILNALQRDLSVDAMDENIQRGEAANKFVLSNQELEWLFHHSENQWVDYLVYRYQFKVYPRTKTLNSFPVHLLIEPTSVCNLRCVMCFMTDKTFTKKEYMGYMPWDLFLKIVEEVKAEKCKAVTLASRGEPTLHPKFGEMPLTLRAAGVMDIKVNTNATRLTEKLCHSILEANVNEVVFSVDAGNKETYESIRVKGKFEEVVANIERFHVIRAKHYSNSQTVTRITGVKVRTDQDEHQMTKFWQRYVDQVTIKRATPRWDSYNNSPVETANPCSVLWERMYVWFDGKVNPCDFDYKSYLCVGNVYEKSLKEIWIGTAFQKVRDYHMGEERRKCFPCDRCSIY